MIQAAVEGRLVLFIGAGVSKQAETKRSDILPDWPELIREIMGLTVIQAGIDANDKAVIEKLLLDGKYLIAAQELKDRIDSRVFESFMQKRFQQDLNPGRIHCSIFKLRTPLIMTTNYDLLLEQALAQVFGTLATVAVPGRTAEVFRSIKAPWTQDSPVIFKLHGTILEPDSMVMGERDYHSLIYRGLHYRLLLRTIFMTQAVLMVGFSFSDPDITDVIAEGAEGSGKGDFIVLPKGKKDRIEMRRLRNNFGVQVIEYEPTDGHPEVRELVDYLAGFAPRRRKKS